MPMKRKLLYGLILLIWGTLFLQPIGASVFVIGESSQLIYTTSSFSSVPTAGDTIKILAERRSRLQFRLLEGTKQLPIVFVNAGGVVRIKGGTMPAIMFENCKYIKISGKGDAAYRYGFYLAGPSFGLSFEQYSSHAEAENIHIDSCSLGVHAKKDFGGHPPFPYPVFSHLAIHDNFIDHCNEAMYIGETKSPGMEFKHVRIYNNVITNSGRESFQIANCVDDIEAYNNFCFNSGLENSIGQLNNSQLGGNSIGRFYNNIFIKAPADGVAIFGKGDMYIIHNYFDDNQGIFSDDRYDPIAGAPLRIENNYFRNTVGTQILALRNVYFDFFVNNNQYNTSIPFVNASTLLLKENTNNRLTTVFPLLYSIDKGMFTTLIDNPSGYADLGPIAGLTHTFNSTPILRTVPDILINAGDYQESILIATTDDNDLMTFEARNMPSFATLVLGPNGSAMLKVDGKNQTKGTYSATILVTDQSHNAVARQTFKIAIKEPNNHAVKLLQILPITLEAASKQTLNISGTDVDGDSIRYALMGKPDFVDFVQTRTSASLILKPTCINTGTYQIIVKATDGYSLDAIDTLTITVVAPILSEGRLLYRINYGGQELEATPINWQKDAGNSTSYEVNYSMGTGSSGWSGVNETGAPNNIFGTFRYNGIGQQDMLFGYPCTNGRYQVNLYFAERNTEVNNNATEVFSIYLENELKQSNVNLYQEAGYSAIKKSYIVDIKDGNIDLKLKKIANNSKLCGVEVIYVSAINSPPVVAKIDTITVLAGINTKYPLSITDDKFPGCGTMLVTTNLQTDFVSIIETTSSYSLTINTLPETIGLFPFTLTATDGCATTTEDGFIKVIPNHINPPIWQPLPIQTVLEGEKDTLFVQFTDADKDPIVLAVSNLPTFANFIDKGNGVGWIFTQPSYTQAGNYSFDISATDSYRLKTSQRIKFVVQDAQPIQRILLNESMIHDLVQGGSVNPASLLVDEQVLNPDKNEHPISANWKPYYTNARAPYHVYFDLGKQYVVRKLKVHDMNNVSLLDFSYGSPEAWVDWFSYSTSAYNSWKNFDCNATTQFLRLSQLNASSAEINEIAIYGYESNRAPQLIRTQLPIYAMNTTDTISVGYADLEKDQIELTCSNLPSFSEFKPLGNGAAQVVLHANQKAIGIYYFTLQANDSKNYASKDTVWFEISKDGSSAIKNLSIEPKCKVYYDKANRLLHVQSTYVNCQTELISSTGQSVLITNDSLIPVTPFMHGIYLVIVRDKESKLLIHRKLIVL